MCDNLGWMNVMEYNYDFDLVSLEVVGKWMGWMSWMKVGMNVNWIGEVMVGNFFGEKWKCGVWYLRCRLKICRFGCGVWVVVERVDEVNFLNYYNVVCEGMLCFCWFYWVYSKCFVCEWMGFWLLCLVGCWYGFWIWSGFKEILCDKEVMEGVDLYLYVW